MHKAIFLDRDGVINESHTERVKFVNDPWDLYLLPGAAYAISLFRQKQFKVFVVTNQGGIHYGLMSVDTLNAIHRRMERLLRK
jgi:D-glycero-D-manno-heptose 1,7-bisphosphate phosphatase